MYVCLHLPQPNPLVPNHCQEEVPVGDDVSDVSDLDYKEEWGWNQLELISAYACTRVVKIFMEGGDKVDMNNIYPCTLVSSAGAAAALFPCFARTILFPNFSEIKKIVR